ncbi:MAG: glycosyltransferase family 2 protein [Planctomycetia bacterium]|nr:glycosyltransferase family 2 protein [Planctomycetia bacterium]
MNVPSVTREQVLQECGRVAGDLRPFECAWMYETAARIKPGGTWVEAGFALTRSFLAAGLGLPRGAVLRGLTCSCGPAPASAAAIPTEAESLRTVARLRELRPDLDIRVNDGNLLPSADKIAPGLVDVVYVQESHDGGWIAAQIEFWRPRLVPGGRLMGFGFGRLEWPAVTRAVVESLPGASTGIGAVWAWTPEPPLDEAVELPRLSVIVASTGRPTLTKTLASIRAQRLLQGDEVLLVHDGQPAAQTVIAWDQARLPGEMLILAGGPHNDWGATARTAGQVRARAGHLLWQDDDDSYLPGAFDVIRREILATPEHILVFRMAYPSGLVLWAYPVVQVKNVSTQMYVFPRTANLGRWGTHYQGDFEFLQTTVAANPNRPARFVNRPIVMYSR